MRATALATFVLLCGACALEPGSAGPPRPLSVAPDHAFADETTSVVIAGEGFAGQATQPSGGGTPGVDTHHRAWLDDAELADVTWVDARTLRATVPAGLPPGAHALAVEGPTHERGTLPAAFTVLQRPGLLVSAASDPVSVLVAQTFTITVTVRNAGATGLASLFVAAPALTSANGARAALVAGPLPAPPATLGAGQEVAIRWTYQATTAGMLSVSASATAADASSGAVVSGAAPDLLVAFQDVSPALAATLRSPPTPSAAHTGQGFDVAVAFTNTGPADLVQFTVATPAVSGVDPARVSVSGPTPAAPATLGAGQTVVLTWHVTSSAPGTLGLGFTAGGVDGVSGTAVSASTAASIVVSAPAALSAVLTTTPSPPATLDLSQAVDVALAITNAGGLPAQVTGLSPTVSPSSGASCQPASPAASRVAPITLAPGTTARFSWTCGVSTPGNYALGASVAAADPATGGALTVTVSAVTLTFTHQASLTVTTGGDGAGTVSSSPAGIGPCGSGGTACSASFPYGTQVTLTASPSAGATVTWSGCDHQTATTCRIDQLTADRTVSVTFTARGPVLTVLVGGSRSGTVTSSPTGISACSATGGVCTWSFALGARVVLTAHPSGKATTTWGAGSCDTTGTNTCTIRSLTADRIVSVGFN